jgi:hypothetical protein
LVLVGEPHSISQHLTRLLYNASISNVMARSRLDLGSSRFWLEEDLVFVLFAKMISTL